jgi:hypothetical protein
MFIETQPSNGYPCYNISMTVSWKKITMDLTLPVGDVQCFQPPFLRLLLFLLPLLLMWWLDNLILTWLNVTVQRVAFLLKSRESWVLTPARDLLSWLMFNRGFHWSLGTNSCLKLQIMRLMLLSTCFPFNFKCQFSLRFFQRFLSSYMLPDWQTYVVHAANWSTFFMNESTIFHHCFFSAYISDVTEFSVGQHDVLRFQQIMVSLVLIQIRFQTKLQSHTLIKLSINTLSELQATKMYMSHSHRNDCPN